MTLQFEFEVTAKPCIIRTKHAAREMRGEAARHLMSPTFEKNLKQQ
jgi:hypothetical protein